MPTKDPKVNTTKEEEQKQIEDDKIVVSKTKLENLIDRVNKLERGEGIVLDSPTELKARIRRYNEGYVVGYVFNEKFNGNVWTLRDSETGEEKEYIELLIKRKNQVDKEVVEYLDFIRKGIQVEVRIKETKTKIRKQNYGVTSLVDENKATGMSYNTGIKVPVDVIFEEKESIIILPSGEELTIDNKFLNM